MEAPNPKHQVPNKYQSPKFETKSFWSFEIGIWSLFGICLPVGREFVIWDFRRHALESMRFADIKD